MIKPVQAIKTAGANTVNGVKNMSTKKKVAAAVGAAAVVGTIALAYSKGKLPSKDVFGPAEKLGFKSVMKTLNRGFHEIGYEIAGKAVQAKDAVVNFFSNLGSKKD